MTPLDRAQLHRDMVEQHGFREFIRLAWHVVEPRSLIHNWHIDAMADHLQAVSALQIRNLIINVPPGSGKSKIVSVLWPAWEWINRPGTRFIYASFDLALSRRDAEAMLDLITSQWFVERWGEKCDRDQAILEFDNKFGGWRYGTSVQGKVTGRHADIRVFDDPIKPLNVTKVALDKCVDWWKGTMGSRVVDPRTSRYVGIMQRIHDRDLTGYLVESDDVEVLRLPMRYESRNPCLTPLGIADPRIEEGELLNPERVPEEEVLKLEKDLGPVHSAAQLQQRPTPEGGNIFEKGWFKRWTFLPKVVDQWWQSWDMSFKGKEDSDFVCGGVWARCGIDYFLVWVINQRLSFSDTLIQVRRTCDEWPMAMSKVVEDKANGTAIIDVLSKEFYGFEEVNPEGGKEARANAVSPLFRSGRVWFPSDPKLYINTSYNEVQKQHIAFPKSVNDDIVDMVSQGLTWGHKNLTNLEEAMRQARIKLGIK